MAVTQGHGNPNWTEDEIVLALDLYFQLEGVVPSSADERVVALSVLLRSFPYHAEAARKQSFRNPDGVAFKLQNLRQVATGKGLPNTSKADKSVWDAFGNDPVATSIRAKSIRASIGLTSQFPSSDGDEDEHFAEGRMATYTHRRRERNPKLRGKLIQARQMAGTLHCDICQFSPTSSIAVLVEAAFEAHHVIPLAEAGESKTRLSDLSLLCATCHRILHRAIALEKRWLTIDYARVLIAGTANGSVAGSASGDIPETAPPVASGET